MTIELNAKTNQFTLLKQKPHAWNVLLDTSTGVSRNDKIKYFEVDNLNNRTGKYITGLVRFVTSGDIIYNNNKKTMANVYTILWNESNI